MSAGYRLCSFLVVLKEFGELGCTEWRVVTKPDESKVALPHLLDRVAVDAGAPTSHARTFRSPPHQGALPLCSRKLRLTLRHLGDGVSSR